MQLPQRGLRWVRGEATPEELPGGGVLWHGYISDISDLKRVEEELRALSVTDSLTGIHNRRYFQERLTTEMARVERGGGELSVIMLDIDHFKRINDQHGHAVGDRVLQAVCERIGHRLRRTDVFCRLGGEEFMVLCPDIDGEQAYVLAVELWQGLRSCADRRCRYGHRQFRDCQLAGRGGRGCVAVAGGFGGLCGEAGGKGSG